jgi:sulfur relay (sulfurtransferase) DsrC/TusE family protein
MDEKKIAFIVCINNNILFEECRYYIDRLILPQGFQKDVIGIFSAESMCAGYNGGMNSSDAKYKVYLHQDVLIKNHNFINDLVQIFEENDRIGLIGMIGGRHMPKTGVTYRAWDSGSVDWREVDMAYILTQQHLPAEHVTHVEAVDGLLIATQYDIPWREDLFKHFHFYDISQSFEMRKAGYEVVVPTQDIPWAIHASNFVDMKNYDEGRQILLREYPEFLYDNDGYEFEYNKYNEEWDLMAAELASEIKIMMEQNRWKEVDRIIEDYHRGNLRSSELEMLRIMSEITRREFEEKIEPNFFSGLDTWDDMYAKYMQTRFLLWRMELGMPEGDYTELIDEIRAQRISSAALYLLICHSVVDKAKVLGMLMDYYIKFGQKPNAKRMESWLETIKGHAVPVCYFQSKPRN